MIKKIKILPLVLMLPLLSLGSLAALEVASTPAPVYANAEFCNDDEVSDEVKAASGCPGYEDRHLERDESPAGGECGGVTLGVDVECIEGQNPIFAYLGAIIRFLTVGVGLVITLMIVIGGIQYITSAGNPQGLESAKKKVLHAIEALLLFIFMAVILNYIIPGGFL